MFARHILGRALRATNTGNSLQLKGIQANSINFASIRLYSGDNKLASFEEVKNLKAGTTLIDVREPKELKETGVIPKSFNIPLGEVEDAFKSLSNEAFQKKYGLQKPKEDYPLVFSCRSGVRSAKAMAAVEKLGYNNVKNYKGGWLDWEEQSKSK